MTVLETLKSLADDDYREFISKLTPSIPKERFLGVRMPKIRGYAKEIKYTDLANEFLQNPDHFYIEELNLHGILICFIKDFNETVNRIEAFLPYINNWATCDIIRPKSFEKNKKELLPYIEKWLKSDKTYTVRFGIEMLMNFYLKEAFDTKYLEKVAKIRSDEYYVKMMQAWYFATALCEQYEATLPYLQTPKMDTWTHNKAIQKARESHVITAEQKEYLNTLKRKEP